MKTSSKQERINLIKEFIKHKEVRTQEELLNYLESQGLQVTQATVSRDVSEVGLQKKGTGYYVLAEEIELKSIFKTLVKKINSSMNIVLVSTVAGAAQTVARYIDSAKISGVLGSVAGDDTIFLLVSENVPARAVVKKLKAFKEG
ncbi:MAG: ArgR family transcriptional regulator [Actinobacteria bacterium]|nr:MAG: ArgR family transcriptional regulator [Actinomycetota bacterium]